MAKKTIKTEKTPVSMPETAIPTPKTDSGEAITAKDERDVKIITKVIENTQIAPQDAFGKLNRPQLELIKRTVAKGASDDELRLFIQVCKGANLNPFLRQVHLVPRWDSRSGQEVRTIQVGIDGFRAVAESSGAYAGNEDPIFNGENEIEYGKEKRKAKVPETATVTVYKLMEGQRFPFTATARWSEYYPGEKMGFQWHIRPYLMLGKCAEALALRKAFPKLLSGMYAQEEMDRTASVDNESKKQQVGYNALITAVRKANLPELEEYRSKMQKSDKYDADQKAQFMKEIDARIKELTPQKVKPVKDDEIPIINAE